MDTLSAQQAAKLLHLNVKRVQALARSGQLPAARVGRKWLFRRADLERMLGNQANEAAALGLELSARNQLRGRITSINLGTMIAEVKMDVGGQELTALITKDSVEKMALKINDEVLAIIKSTQVIIGKG
ncbi:MAG TPA: TOBE domain-containing protein [Gemmatimonadales bacterium]|nr:TOBE domain-containing protein [Gemmatimonadales bacterium]